MRSEVLDHVGLIQDHIIPRFPLENMRITAGEGIGGDADVEVIFIIPALSQLFSPLRRPMIT